MRGLKPSTISLTKVLGNGRGRIRRGGKDKGAASAPIDEAEKEVIDVGKGGGGAGESFSGLWLLDGVVEVDGRVALMIRSL